MLPEALGPYRIVRELGRGGMGVVLLAEDSRLGRKVAIKLLARAADPTALARFQREARAVAALQHPQIAVLHDTGTHEGLSYLVFEYVEGETLASRLEHGPLPFAEVLTAAQQLAAALEHAHRHGVLHRDIKPGNVILSPHRGAVLLDFGLARWVEAAGPGSSASGSTATLASLTREGFVAGTAAYMSPEQLRGDALDERSDLFQLGVLLYQAAAGAHPFAAATLVDLQHAVLHETPAPLHEVADVPEEFSRVAAKLLEKDPAYRYPDTRALLVDLRTVSRGSTGGEVIPLERQRGAPPWRLWAAYAALALVAMAAAGVAWRWYATASRGSSGSSLARLTPLPLGNASATQPDFAPDGRHVVFVSDRGGQWDVWTATLDGQALTQITATPEAESSPAWSPDGTRIAFSRHSPAGGVDVYVVPAGGGEARRVVEAADDPAWSRDGAWIAYADFSSGWSRIAKRRADGGGPPVAITHVEEGFFHRRPAWSPDGSTIVFNRSPGGWAGQLMRVPASGGKPEPLTRDPAGTVNLAADFNPDGDVVHVSDRGGGVNLWRIPASGGDPEPITAGPGDDLFPAVSPDGRRIVFAHTPATMELLEIEPAEGRLRPLAAFDNASVWGPDPAPQGDGVVFSRKLPGKRWELAWLDGASGTVRPLLALPHDVLLPRFEPDGAHIVFYARTEQGRRVGRVGRDGRDVEWLTPTTDDAGFPDASPDGRWLAFVAHGEGGSSVMLQPFEGGEARVVADRATLPRFSPDGRRLALARSRSYTGGIGVAELPHGRVRWLTTSGSWPEWSPDGRFVYYADASGGGAQRAWRVPVEGGPPEPVEGVSWNTTHQPFTIHRSGIWLTTAPGPAHPSLWIAELTP